MLLSKAGQYSVNECVKK